MEINFNLRNSNNFNEDIKENNEILEKYIDSIFWVSRTEPESLDFLNDL